jgi:hypothetical protein
MAKGPLSKEDGIMSDDVVKEIMEKTDLLTADEQLYLIAEIAEKVRRSAFSEPKEPLKWSDLVGMLPYPACGEDAQEYISRSRREADENRQIDTTS